MSIESRRQFLFGSSAGLGSIALTALLQQERLSAATHHPAKAKACIFLTMEGGPSHIDTFDPKPKLSQMHMTEFVRRDKFASAMESGTRYFVLRNTRKFTVTAIGLGDPKQQQFTVTVDPNIKPTENGYVVAGNTGGQGGPGRSCNDERPTHPPCYPTRGKQGQRGGDGILRQRLPPLDTIHDRPARVLPIAITGGRGGPGGDGGHRETMWGEEHDQQPQGPGGMGADAIR